MRLKKQSPSINLLPVVFSVPADQEGLIHVWGRNDMDTPQHLGIRWTVKDPNGNVVVHYPGADQIEWTTFDAEPGVVHQFYGHRFALDKAGTYTLIVDLLMNPDNPVVVSSYDGDLCTVTTELPPEYELIQHTVYPFAYIYDGNVEITTATFKTDPFTPSAWLGGIFASKLEDEIRVAGGIPIDVKVYVDKTPLLWTEFRVEVIGTPISGVAKLAQIGAVGIAPWLAIILVCLAVTAIIVVTTLAINTIVGLFNHKPELEQVKPGWSKETLIMTIQDSEVYWERTPTPIDVLEAMSEAELRDHLDQVAEEELPPEKPSPWLWIGIGATAAVAVAALSAMTRRRR